MKQQMNKILCSLILLLHEAGKLETTDMYANFIFCLVIRHLSINNYALINFFLYDCLSFAVQFFVSFDLDSQTWSVVYPSSDSQVQISTYLWCKLIHYTSLFSTFNVTNYTHKYYRIQSQSKNLHTHPSCYIPVTGIWSGPF